MIASLCEVKKNHILFESKSIILISSQILKEKDLQRMWRFFEGEKFNILSHDQIQLRVSGS